MDALFIGLDFVLTTAVESGNVEYLGISEG